MVPNTSDDLPDPETPVNTVSRRLGISTLTSFRLFTRAPCTRIRSWLSAECRLEEAMFALTFMSGCGCVGSCGCVIVCGCVWCLRLRVGAARSLGMSHAAPLGGIRQHEQVQTGEQEQGERGQRQVAHPGGRLLLPQGDEGGDDGHGEENGQPAVGLPNRFV